MGLSIGVTAMVARRIGEKNLEGAAEAAVQGIALGVIVAVVTGAIGVAFAPRLLALMGASPEVLTIGSTYARIMLGGRSEEHTSELQSRLHLVCRLLLEKKKKNNIVESDTCMS